MLSMRCKSSAYRQPPLADARRVWRGYGGRRATCAIYRPASAIRHNARRRSTLWIDGRVGDDVDAQDFRRPRGRAELLFVWLRPNRVGNHDNDSPAIGDAGPPARSCVIDPHVATFGARPLGAFIGAVIGGLYGAHAASSLPPSASGAVYCDYHVTRVPPRSFAGRYRRDRCMIPASPTVQQTSAESVGHGMCYVRGVQLAHDITTCAPAPCIH